MGGIGFARHRQPRVGAQHLPNPKPDDGVIVDN
jgi:hypothetical protein